MYKKTSEVCYKTSEVFCLNSYPELGSITVL